MRHNSRGHHLFSHIPPPLPLHNSTLPFTYLLSSSLLLFRRFNTCVFPLSLSILPSTNAFPTHSTLFPFHSSFPSSYSFLSSFPSETFFPFLKPSPPILIHSVHSRQPSLSILSPFLYPTLLTIFSFPLPFSSPTSPISSSPSLVLYYSLSIIISSCPPLSHTHFLPSPFKLSLSTHSYLSLSLLLPQRLPLPFSIPLHPSLTPFLFLLPFPSFLFSHPSP